MALFLTFGSGLMGVIQDQKGMAVDVITKTTDMKLKDYIRNKKVVFVSCLTIGKAFHAGILILVESTLRRSTPLTHPIVIKASKGLDNKELLDYIRALIFVKSPKYMTEKGEVKVSEEDLINNGAFYGNFFNHKTKRHCLGILQEGEKDCSWCDMARQRENHERYFRIDFIFMPDLGSSQLKIG